MAQKRDWAAPVFLATAAIREGMHGGPTAAVVPQYDGVEMYPRDAYSTPGNGV